MGETSFREKPLDGVDIEVAVATIQYWLHLCPYSMHLSSFVGVLGANSIVEFASPLTNQILQASPVDKTAGDNRIALQSDQLPSVKILGSTLTKTA
jgi:hypothetical protein